MDRLHGNAIIARYYVLLELLFRRPSATMGSRKPDGNDVKEALCIYGEIFYGANYGGHD